MSRAGEAVRRHHRQLSSELTRRITALVEARPEADPGGLARFLAAELLPHAAGEERHLYPAVEPLLKAHGQATATMSVDHEYIERLVGEIDEAARALEAAPDAERPALEQRLRRRALQLLLLVEVHLEKEERIYLPLFEAHLSEAEQDRVLHAMHQEEPPARDIGEVTVDVRAVPPARRHPLIFDTFDRLAPGSSLLLVNDHDPKPLYYQFVHERPERFGWEYLEEGPRVWRVRIARLG